VRTRKKQGFLAPKFTITEQTLLYGSPWHIVCYITDTDVMEDVPDNKSVQSNRLGEVAVLSEQQSQSGFVEARHNRSTIYPPLDPKLIVTNF
jgi:hypothetical protein